MHIHNTNTLTSTYNLIENNHSVNLRSYLIKSNKTTESNQGPVWYRTQCVHQLPKPRSLTRFQWFDQSTLPSPYPVDPRPVSPMSPESTLVKGTRNRRLKISSPSVSKETAKNRLSGDTCHRIPTKSQCRIRTRLRCSYLIGPDRYVIQVIALGIVIQIE